MSFRHAARVMVDRAAVLTGFLDARQRAMRDGLTVLMYHRVLPDQLCHVYQLPALSMKLSIFREQIRYLSAHFRVVTMSQGVEWLEYGDPGGPATISLTFDDGYADSFSIIAPTLEENGVRGTFYVTTGLIGTDQLLWFDQAATQWAGLDWKKVGNAVARLTGRTLSPVAAPVSLPEWVSFLKILSNSERRQLIEELGSAEPIVPNGLDRIMTPQELVELARRGHEIGSHSSTHPLLLQLTDIQLDDELLSSRGLIASWLGSQPQGFCYPNGDYDDRVVLATQRAGYLHACTTRSGRNSTSQDPFRLLRIDMNARRVTRHGAYDQLAMRAEISLLHEVMR
jgi:peptidoglycan/xylan/chitin deacetylase (PgdA/CDA1 family)